MPRKVKPGGTSEQQHAQYLARKNKKLQDKRSINGVYRGLGADEAPDNYVASKQEIENIEIMVTCGLTTEQIASIMKMSIKTLYANFPYELETGKLIKVREVAKTLYNAAVGGNIAACIFFLKTQGRWRENDPTPLMMPPDRRDRIAELDRLTPEEIHTLFTLQKKAMGESPNPKMIEASYVERE